MNNNKNSNKNNTAQNTPHISTQVSTHATSHNAVRNTVTVPQSDPIFSSINTIPGDKSISHRAVILGALAENDSHFQHFLCAEDCLNTLHIFQQLGVPIRVNTQTRDVWISGVGLRGLKEADNVLDVGNSGTGIRLITGVLAAQPFSSAISGDASIQKRPMKRVIEPLSKMGALITGVETETNIVPPLKINGTPTLNPISSDVYTPEVASAQVKSAIILASLFADGPTQIRETYTTRDHTELMLNNLSENVILHPDKTIEIIPPVKIIMPTTPILIPCDFSSAAFFIALGLCRPNTGLTLTGISLNPTRSALLDILFTMNADIEIKNEKTELEPIGDIHVATSQLDTNVIIQDKAIMPFIIDEIPILAVIALFGNGTLEVRNAEELRIKESDRINAIAHMITQLGGEITVYDDGFKIKGKGQADIPKDIVIDSFGDHRIAMSAIIASHCANQSITVKNTDCINTSFPNFFDILSQLGLKTAPQKTEPK